MAQHPRLSERLRSIVPNHVRRHRSRRCEPVATTAPVDVADAGQQFASRLREALPDRAPSRRR